MKRKRKRPRKPLTEQQKQAARVLFDTGRIGDTAATVGVHRTTIWRWYKRRDFQREINIAHDKWIAELRRKYRREWIHSPEHKQELEARRRLKALEKGLSEAGNRGDMRAYRQACAAYDKCFNEAYGRTILAYDRFFSSREFSEPKKAPEPKKYIVEIIE